MIEVQGDSLVFTFPEVHPKARLEIGFQRTLRIPDDDREYSLPPGLGQFPIRHVDDHAASVPETWIAHGGVMLPMHQAEAMWMNFDAAWDDERGVEYPFAVKIATGKVNAVSGKPWKEGLHRRPQDYVVVPEQPWLDGYCIEKGVIRQFVAMPLGEGYSAEEQITGKADVGGLQILVAPMKAAAYKRRFPKIKGRYAMVSEAHYCCSCCESPDMGLAPGGRMRQEIYRDPYRLEEWSVRMRGRCFVHICDSARWQAITGTPPPTRPPTAAQYTAAGLPWFEYYGEGEAIAGSGSLAKMKSVATLARRKRVPLAGNGAIGTARLVHLRSGLRPGQVREWDGSAGA